MEVGQAVRVVRTGTDVHFSGLAHQVVIVDAFGPLAGPDVRENLGQAAISAGVDEGGTGGVIFSPADGDRRGVARRVVVERTVGNAAVCDVRCHGIILVSRLPGRAAPAPR